MSSTIIIGAGWAGLNCAYELCKAGHNITLIEAAPQVGGRARSIKFGSSIVDNGQHIALGAYHTMRTLIAELGLREHELFKVLPLEMYMYGSDNLHFRLPKLPPPINFFYGILTARCFTWSEKLHILKFARHLHKTNFKLKEDCTLLTLLLNYNQSKRVIAQFWEPIAVAAMSTDIKTASAQVFLNILSKTFNGDLNNSNWYLPTVDLNNLLPNRIVNFLKHRQQTVICNNAIKKIHLHHGMAQVTSNNQSWEAKNLVLATPACQTLKLLQPYAQLQDLCKILSMFHYETITTVYLQFSTAINLSYPILGMLNTTSQWIFDRAFIAQPNILSVVISGNTANNLPDNASLYRQVLEELQQYLSLPTPIAYKVIREKRAAFTCDPTTQKIRPSATTSFKNLWLCGDYVQTGLPATLEGALLSGKQTSREVLSADL